MGGDQVAERAFAGQRAAYERADDGVRVAERGAPLDQPLGQVGGCRGRGVGRRLHPLRNERGGGDHARQRAERQADLVDSIEERLLVLLQVPVVGEGQPLQRHQQPGEVADDTTGAAARQLGDVRVLLLRQHRRPGGVGVIEPGEAQLVARPQHPLLPHPRQVDGDESQIEQRLGDEVPVGDGVEAVLEDGCKPEIGCGRRRVEREGRAGKGAGAEGRHVQALDRHQEAVHITRQCPPVGQQVVGQQHGLGPLEVRVAGQVGVTGLHGPIEQHLLQPDHAGGDGGDLVLAPQA